MRIFIGPIEVAGYGTGLKSGFDAIEVDAELILKTPHRFVYDKEASSSSMIPSVWMKLGGIRDEFRSRGYVFRMISLCLHKMWDFVVFFWALFRFDVFIFLYGNTILNLELELYILKLFNKKILFVYFGSDTRPAFIDGAVINNGTDVGAYTVRKINRKRSRKVKFQEKMADFCINSPFTAQFHNNHFINWFSIGVPKEVKFKPIVKKQMELNIFRILHSPSHIEIKGSEKIENVVKKIMREDSRIEYVELKNSPNCEVLEAISNADLVIDQLFSDTPMAGLSMEAAAIGTPVIVAGYASQFDWEEYMSSEIKPPTVFVLPEELENAVRNMISDTVFRQECAQKCKDFVETYWGSEIVAKRFIKLLNNDFSNDWWFETDKVQFLYSCGVSEAKSISITKEMINTFGLSALCLEMKPELVENIIVQLNHFDKISNA